MASTLIGGAGPEYPRTEPTVMVERKPTWSDPWLMDWDLEPVRASEFTGHDLGTCILRRRYAPAVSAPAGAPFEERQAKTLRGHWVRLSLVGGGDAAAEGGVQPIWTGRIAVEKRSVQGAAGGERGLEVFIAYGPLDLLRKVRIHHSFWNVGDAAVELGWVPPVNIRRRHDIEGGNRSAAMVGVSYLYDFDHDASGVPWTWTNADYLVYILKRFVQVDDGPVWTIGGAVDLIEDLTLRIPLRGGESALELLDRLVPARYACGYRICATEAGFEVRIFSLVSHHAVFYGQKVKANPDSILIDATDSHDLIECEVEISDTQTYDKVRVVGERRKVVTSIAGIDIGIGWTSALETLYKAGTGNPGDKPEAHDAARGDDRFRHVYQAFVAAASWNPPSPALDGFGQEAEGTATRQNTLRRTLPYLLLREGWDYTQDPPVNMNPEGIEGGFLPPLVLVRLVFGVFNKWCPVDKVRMATAGMQVKMTNATVSPLEHEWGVLIESTPNHALAKNHWAGANPATLHPDDDGVDHDNMAITMTVEQDHHLEVTYDLPEGFRANDGSVMVLYERGAEFWYLAPETYLGVAADGSFLKSPSTGVELRNDAWRLARVAAGAVARYCTYRARASITERRLQAWGELLGHILAVVQDEENADTVYAPITSVEWLFEGSPRTTIKTGFAS